MQSIDHVPRIGRTQCIRSGKLIWPLDPRLQDLNLIGVDDVVHALSLENRWSGHTVEPISVATHTIGVVEIVEAMIVFHNAPDGHLLLRAAAGHELGEAIVKDVPGPLKSFLFVPELGCTFRALEHRWRKLLAQRLAIPDNLFEHPWIKLADRLMEEAERRMGWPGQDGPVLHQEVAAAWRLIPQWVHAHPALSPSLPSTRARLRQLLSPSVVPTVLHCPECGAQHIDKGEWAVHGHIRHLCEPCKHTWTPPGLSGQRSVGVQGYCEGAGHETVREAGLVECPACCALFAGGASPMPPHVAGQGLTEMPHEIAIRF